MIMHSKIAVGAGLFLVLLPAAAMPIGPGQAVAAGTPQSNRLPETLRSAFYGALARDAGAAYAIDRSGCVRLSKPAWKACFDRSGASFTGGGAPLALRLAAWGRGARLAPVAEVSPLVEGNRVVFARGDLAEWWRVLPFGFEQGFTIAKRPPGTGELKLALATSRTDGGAADRNTVAWGKLRYGQLAVTDARGHALPATLETQGKHILVAIDDARAVYPLTVDPLVWLEQEVSASDGAAGDSFGWAVALSGRTGLIGAPFVTVDGNAYQGAAYVFSESNGRWTQASRLVASDGESDDEFGIWVALAGTTALVGAPFGDDGNGAAYVFQRADGVWTQTGRLSANDGAPGDHFGWSVAADGASVLVGAPFATVANHGDQGAAYVFADENGDWTQTAKLVSSDGAADDSFGWSVALDGGTALISAYSADGYTGAAYVFGKSGGVWTQLQELAASDGTANDNFGWRVALDGPTALVGATGTGDYRGAVYVFTKSAGTWEQLQELGADDGAPGDDFGWSVALAGSTAVVGAAYGNAGTGAAYVFERSNGTWLQTQRLIASNGEAFDAFGWSAAAGKETAIFGADGAIVGGNSFQGAAYVEGASDLGLALSAPQSVGQGDNYVSQTIATNNASATSPAVSATITVPVAASFVSAAASQGSCSEDSGVVTCDFGAIAGNAGTASANVTLKATGAPGDTIENTAHVAKATPGLSATAPTEITGSQSCPDGYTSYSGMLAPGANVRIPPYTASAGEEDAILYAPEGFRLYARVDATLWGRYQRGFPATEVHRHGPAGEYRWLVRGSDAGGDYLFCLMHP